MNVLRTYASLALAAVVLLAVSGGAAQEGSVGDFGQTVRQDDLDSFWLDSRVWSFYGYRSYAKAHPTRFAGNMPTWSSGSSSYSFGINEPAGNAPWEGGPQAPFQMSKNGTWH